MSEMRLEVPWDYPCVRDPAVGFAARILVGGGFIDGGVTPDAAEKAAQFLERGLGSQEGDFGGVVHAAVFTLRRPELPPGLLWCAQRRLGGVCLGECQQVLRPDIGQEVQAGHRE